MGRQSKNSFFRESQLLVPSQMTRVAPECWMAVFTLTSRLEKQRPREAAELASAIH